MLRRLICAAGTLSPASAPARHMGTRKIAYTGSGRDIAKKTKSKQLRRGERHDSVSADMLADRDAHLARINDDQAVGELLESGHYRYDELSRDFRKIEERVEQLALGRRRGFACRKRFGQMLGAVTVSTTMPVVGADLVRRVRTARGDLPPTAKEALRLAAMAERKQQQQQQQQQQQRGRKQQQMSAAAMVAQQLARSHGALAAPTPEIGIIGHSNSGKSSLVNVLAGKKPTEGVARVSPRAGWTSSLDFYLLRLLDRDGGPSLVLVDMPGYGPAVADVKTRQRWWDASLRYARQGKAAVAERDGGGLRCMLILVDCSRGFCEEDEALFGLLAERGCPFQVVLTKADLLPPAELARCNLLLTADLRAKYGGRTLAGSDGQRPLLLLDEATGALPMVSALHLQGITEIFEDLIVARAFE